MTQSIPEGFTPTDDAIDSQVRCEDCGCVCTVGVQYGERAEDHECPGDRPRHEDAGHAAPGF